MMGPPVALNTFSAALVVAVSFASPSVLMGANETSSPGSVSKMVVAKQITAAVLLLLACVAGARGQECFAIETDYKVSRIWCLRCRFACYQVFVPDAYQPPAAAHRLKRAMCMFLQYNIPQGVYGTNGGCVKGEGSWADCRSTPQLLPQQSPLVPF